MFTDITTSRPQPSAVAYEAGFGLTRNLTDANIRCVVASLSKLQGLAGVRVKTDKIDALHMAKLLRLKEVTPGDCPTSAPGISSGPHPDLQIRWR